MTINVVKLRSGLSWRIRRGGGEPQDREVAAGASGRWDAHPTAIRSTGVPVQRPSLTDQGDPRSRRRNLRCDRRDGAWARSDPNSGEPAPWQSDRMSNAAPGPQCRRPCRNWSVPNEPSAGGDPIARFLLAGNHLQRQRGRPPGCRSPENEPIPATDEAIPAHRRAPPRSPGGPGLGDIRSRNRASDPGRPAMVESFRQRRAPRGRHWRRPMSRLYNVEVWPDGTCRVVEAVRAVAIDRDHPYD